MINIDGRYWHSVQQNLEYMKVDIAENRWARQVVLNHNHTLRQEKSDTMQSTKRNGVRERILSVLVKNVLKES